MAEHYEELAHHFSQGEDWAKAFEYLAHSGDRAKDASANQVALDWYARALDAAAKAPTAVPRKRLAEVHQRRGQIFTTSARLDEGLADAARMLELARAEADRRLEGEALADMAYAHYMTLSWDHVPELKRCAEEAYAIAEEIGDDRLRARTLFLMGSLDQMEERLAEADAKFTESLRIARAGGFRAIVVQSLTLGGVQRNWQADFDGAIVVAREAETTSREIHDGFNELFAMSNRAFAHLGLGDYGAAHEVILAARDLARERDNHFIVGRVTNTLGWLYQEFGDFTRARELDRESADLGHRIKNGNVEISALINIGFDDLTSALPSARSRSSRRRSCARRRRSARIAGGGPSISDSVSPRRCSRSAVTAKRWRRPSVGSRTRRRRARGNTSDGSTPCAARSRFAPAPPVGRPKSSRARSTSVARSAIPRSRGRPPISSARRRRQAAGEEAFASATLARETIDRIAAAAPEPELRATLAAWDRVAAVHETLERLRRG